MLRFAPSICFKVNKVGKLLLDSGKEYDPVQDVPTSFQGREYHKPKSKRYAGLLRGMKAEDAKEMENIKSLRESSH